MAEVIEQHGQLDILVNNAGITVDKTVAKMTDDDWNKVLSVNLSAPSTFPRLRWRTCWTEARAASSMSRPSIGETGNIGQANAASKAGLFGLTKTLAREALFQLARSGRLGDGSIGLTVNTVTTGFVTTEMLDASRTRCR